MTTLSAARQAIRTQKALDGATPIGGTPRYLLVGPATETVAEQVLATLYPAQTSSANPFSGRLELVVEPRLAGNSWFVFCDPAQLPVLQHSYLEAAQGPQLATEQDFDTLGLKFRCVLDFGVGVVDHRGVYRNPGALRFRLRRRSGASAQRRLTGRRRSPAARRCLQKREPE